MRRRTREPDDRARRADRDPRDRRRAAGVGSIGRGRPRAVIYGYYDVQPVGGPEEWSSPPFSPTVRDAALWGRGVGDNKGQRLAHLCALAAWLDVCGTPPPFEIVFALDGEEEIGSPHSTAFIRDNSDRFAGDFLYMADGSTLGVPNPAIFLEFHGLLYLELRREGYPGKSPASSARDGQRSRSCASGEGKRDRRLYSCRASARRCFQ